MNSLFDLEGLSKDSLGTSVHEEIWMSNKKRNARISKDELIV